MGHRRTGARVRTLLVVVVTCSACGGQSLRQEGDGAPAVRVPPAEDAGSEPLLDKPRLSSSGSTGNGRSCALSVRGELTCWGGRDAPGAYAPTPEGRYLDVAQSERHTCAIDESGGLVCWGYDALVPPEGHFTRFTGDWNVSTFCAFRSDDTVTCFGPASEPWSKGPFRAFSYLVLECTVSFQGLLECQNLPNSSFVSPPFPEREWADVMQTTFSFCAVDVGGEVFCAWSSENEFITSRSNCDQVSVGFVGACAVKTDQTLDCWPITRAPVETPPSGTFDAVAVGFYSACGARTDGSVVCWGRNDTGQGSPPDGLRLR